MNEKCGSGRVCDGTCGGQQAGELTARQIIENAYDALRVAGIALRACEGLSDAFTDKLVAANRALTTARCEIGDIYLDIIDATTPS